MSQANGNASFSLPGGRQAASQNGNERATDLDRLNDPTQLAGVDLKAEEEKMRQANQAQQAKTVSLGRQRMQVNEKALQTAVVKIAANYGLKFLEPDTLPMLALAVQTRVRTLMRAMVESRDHRASTNFLRPPPNYDGDFERTGEWAPMWDEVMYDDAGKVLTTYDQLERAEERRARIERTARDNAERQEQAAKEAAEAAAKVAEPEPTTKKGKKEKQKQMVTEQQSHELMQRTALAQLGGPKLPAWAMGNIATPSLNKSKAASSGPDAANGTPAPQQETLVPLASSIERARLPPDTLDSPISWRDAVFALERERGGGSLSGGGRALHTAHVRRGAKRAHQP